MFALSQLSTVIVLSFGNLALATHPHSHPGHHFASALRRGYQRRFCMSLHGFAVEESIQYFEQSRCMAIIKHFTIFSPPKSQALKPPLDLSETLHEHENKMCLPWKDPPKPCL